VMTIQATDKALISDHHSVLKSRQDFRHD